MGVRYVCYQCEYLASYKEDFKRYKIHKHEGTNYAYKQLYNCEKCDATFKSKLGMNLNKRTKPEVFM